MQKIRANRPSFQHAHKRRDYMSIKSKIKSMLLPNENDGEVIYQNKTLTRPHLKKGTKQITPKVYMVSNYYEVEDIAKNLFLNQSVIVNLTNLITKDKYRVVDFLSGVIYSVDGKRSKLENNIYLFTPKEIE